MVDAAFPLFRVMRMHLMPCFHHSLATMGTWFSSTSTTPEWKGKVDTDDLDTEDDDKENGDGVARTRVDSRLCTNMTSTEDTKDARDKE